MEIAITIVIGTIIVAGLLILLIIKKVAEYPPEKDNRDKKYETSRK